MCISIVVWIVVCVGGTLPPTSPSICACLCSVLRMSLIFKNARVSPMPALALPTNSTLPAPEVLICSTLVRCRFELRWRVRGSTGFKVEGKGV